MRTTSSILFSLLLTTSVFAQDAKPFSRAECSEDSNTCAADVSTMFTSYIENIKNKVAQTLNLKKMQANLAIVQVATPNVAPALKEVRSFSFTIAHFENLLNKHAVASTIVAADAKDKAISDLDQLLDLTVATFQKTESDKQALNTLGTEVVAVGETVLNHYLTQKTDTCEAHLNAILLAADYATIRAYLGLDAKFFEDVSEILANHFPDYGVDDLQLKSAEVSEAMAKDILALLVEKEGVVKNHCVSKKPAFVQDLKNKTWYETLKTVKGSDLI